MSEEDRNREAVAETLRKYADEHTSAYDFLAERHILSERELATFKDYASEAVKFFFWPHEGSRVIELDDQTFCWMMFEMVTSIVALGSLWPYYFEHQKKPDRTGDLLSKRVNPLRLTTGVNFLEALHINLETGGFRVGTLPNHSSAGNLNALAAIFFRVFETAFPDAPVMEATTAFADWSSSFGNELLSKETRAELSPRVVEKYKPFKAAMLNLSKWLAVREGELNAELAKKGNEAEIQTEAAPDQAAGEGQSEAQGNERDPWPEGMTLQELAAKIEADQAAAKEAGLAQSGGDEGQEGQKRTFEEEIGETLHLTILDMTRQYLYSPDGQKLIAEERKKEPTRYLDSERYREVEERVIGHAHTPPSVSRTHALLINLRQGLVLAYKPPVDLEVAKCKWLAACLDLLSADPLSSPHNTWKRTLSVVDQQLILQEFTRAVVELIRWQQAAMATEPLADFEEWGGLIEAVQRYLVAGHVVRKDGKLFHEVAEELILMPNVKGQLHIHDNAILGLLSACEAKDALELYRKMEVPNSMKIDAAGANAGLEFNSYYLCCQGDAQIRLCHKYLNDRLTAYNQTEDSAAKREIFNLTPGNNAWFDYCLKEYCTPVLCQIKMSSYPKENADNIIKNLQTLDTLMLTVCQLIVEDSNKSPAAVKMIEAWIALRGKFTVRALHSPTPTYEQQKMFYAELSKFMELFAEAAKTINLEKMPGRKASEAEAKKYVLDRKAFRFSYSKDYYAIRDDEHQLPEYKIDTYEGITAPAALECIKALLKEAGNRSTEGWVKVPADANWRGAFPAKNKALHRFKVDQIEVGKNNTEHQGYWRFYLNSEFDTKSPKGKFFKRTP